MLQFSPSWRAAPLSLPLTPLFTSNPSVHFCILVSEANGPSKKKSAEQKRIQTSAEQKSSGRNGLNYYSLDSIHAQSVQRHYWDVVFSLFVVVDCFVFLIVTVG